MQAGGSHQRVELALPDARTGVPQCHVGFDVGNLGGLLDQRDFLVAFVHPQPLENATGIAEPGFRQQPLQVGIGEIRHGALAAHAAPGEADKPDRALGVTVVTDHLRGGSTVLAFVADVFNALPAGFVVPARPAGYGPHCHRGAFAREYQRAVPGVLVVDPPAVSALPATLAPDEKAVDAAPVHFGPEAFPATVPLGEGQGRVSRIRPSFPGEEPGIRYHFQLPTLTGSSTILLRSMPTPSISDSSTSPARRYSDEASA